MSYSAWRFLSPLVAACLIVLHVLGYWWPDLIVGSRLVTRVVGPCLLAAMIFAMRLARISTRRLKGDPVIRWGSWSLAAMAIVETLILMSLTVGRLGDSFLLYQRLGIDSALKLEAERSRFELLMAFSVIAMLTWPAIVIAVRGSLITSPEEQNNPNLRN